MTAVNSPLAAALAGRYALERELGRGGMATVYLAQDLRHDRPVALKVLHPALAQSLGPERFQREIRFAARLQHPHILTVYDSGEAAGRLWFTMPFVEGESLRDRLRRERQLPVDDALRIAAEAARALEYAHQHGVVHRDVKPENIMVTRDGDTLVADFGIARGLAATGGGDERLTETGLAIGTPAYMSPEQATGDHQVDARTDIYSLGTVLYEMLAGEPPFTGATAQAMIARRLSGEVPRVRQVRPSVPEAVEQAIQRALAPLAADRFATAAQLAQTLATAAASAAGSTPAFGSPTVPAARVRRPLWGPIAAGVGVLLLLGAAILMLLRRPREEPASEGPVRLAVLPFDNRGAPEDEYFADGMTDEVRGKLSALPALKVVARTSSSGYKKSSKAADEIGRELEAQYLLTATVHWVKGGAGGDRVRVSPELIETRDASTKWQESFDASVTDVFQVQGEIAARVAKSLDVVLGNAELAGLAAAPTQNLAAYDAFTRGEEATNGLTETDPINMRKAQAHYERAVALDPTFVRAWLQLTRLHVLHYANGSDPTPARKELARRAMERVVALSPDGVDAHWARGAYADMTGDRERAAMELAAGLRLAPGNVHLLRGAARLEAAAGQWEAAIGHLRQAASLDPRSVTTFLALAGRLLGERRYDEAVATADRAVTIDPTGRTARFGVITTRVAAGDLEGARQVIRSSPTGTDTTGLLMDLAILGHGWVLDSAQQAQVLALPLAAFNDDRTTWGGTRAELFRLRGDSVRMRAYADSARVLQEKLVRDEPNHADQSQHLATHLALSGHKTEAVKEGERALALALASRDQTLIPYIRHRLARVYVIVGEPERAIVQLKLMLAGHFPITPERLSIDPIFRDLDRRGLK